MIVLSYETSCLIDRSAIRKNIAALQPEIVRIKQATKRYLSSYDFSHLPFDMEIVEEVQRCVHVKKQLNPSICIVIGIGGSNRGAIAVHQALQGVLYNALHLRIKLYFVDTVDSAFVNQLYEIVEQEIKQGRSVIVNVISKSGTTIETIANFEIFLALLKQYYSDTYHNYVVVTTDRGSPLWNFADQEQFSRLAIPVNVGGRYSVFSAVGLFPLALVGINIEAVLEGARSITASCIMTAEDNIAGLGASIFFEWYKKGIDIFDLFLFSVELEGVGMWYRQLVGESIGKECTTENKKAYMSILPTVSIGSSDLHSMVQRYLAGKRNVGTYFVTINGKTELALPHYSSFSALVPNIQGKRLSVIMDAIINGVQTSYRNNALPFIHTQLLERNEYCLGQFLQYMMITVVYLAYLVKVNPFDQPAVQKYKNETRKLLKNG